MFRIAVPNAGSLKEFQWTPQPAAAAWMHEASRHVREQLPWAASYAQRLQNEAGVRFDDLIDTVLLGDNPERIAAAEAAGWVRGADDRGWEMYHHPDGLFPLIAVGRRLPAARIAIDLKVESIEDFLRANGLDRTIVGDRGAPWRWASIEERPGLATLGAVERLGWRGLWNDGRHVDPRTSARLLDGFRARRRGFDEDAGFDDAERLIDGAIQAAGRDVACHLFFSAEREYWERRNRAGQVQKARQDRLGLGWANHDHHTYRASRRHFAGLISIFERLGFQLRERFYAGREAGWGAQIVEQPNAGIVIFADVDLSPDELVIDFAHNSLPERDRLGTVGLWCALHGESFLEAGMHHLECQFDFDALKRQLESEAGVQVMKPFTNFPYLRQAFTEGDRWPVRPERIDRLLDARLITHEQASKFRAEGAIGSHLENLERNDGFKGFNQTGVSEIIARTDPRHAP